MSDVQEIIIGKNHNGLFIKVFYKFGPGNTEYLYCKSEKQRDWLLKRINHLLMETRNQMISGTPKLHWIDFNAEWKDYEKELQQEKTLIEKPTLITTQEEQKEVDKSDDEQTKTTPVGQLEEPDNRPGWKKLLNID